MKRPILFSLAASALLLGACSEMREVRFVGTLTQPYCAPDQSVVLGVFPNDNGRYGPIKSSPANCAWYDGEEAREITVAAN